MSAAPTGALHSVKIELQPDPGPRDVASTNARLKGVSYPDLCYIPPSFYSPESDSPHTVTTFYGPESLGTSWGYIDPSYLVSIAEPREGRETRDEEYP